MSKKLLYILLFSLCWTGLHAEQIKKIYQYEISYVNIPLLDMKLTWVEDDSSVHISYDNQLKPFIAFFHPIHNIYRVHFRKESFVPLSWSKSISEGSMRFQFGAKRSADGNKVNLVSGEEMVFPENGFTVFSATHFLAHKAEQSDYFPTVVPIFIDGEIWEARATRYDAKHPHSIFSVDGDEILIQTDLHYLSGTSIIEKNDVLTSVIAKEGTRFYLWVAPDGTYTKAQFGTFPKAVVLKLVNNE